MKTQRHDGQRQSEHDPTGDQYEAEAFVFCQPGSTC